MRKIINWDLKNSIFENPFPRAKWVQNSSFLRFFDFFDRVEYTFFIFFIIENHICHRVLIENSNFLQNMRSPRENEKNAKFLVFFEKKSRLQNFKFCAQNKSEIGPTVNICHIILWKNFPDGRSVDKCSTDRDKKYIFSQFIFSKSWFYSSIILQL